MIPLFFITALEFELLIMTKENLGATANRKGHSSYKKKKKKQKRTLHAALKKYKKR
jgi:hypothetical protein